MLKYISTFISVISCFSLISCSGITFSESPVNQPLPDEFKNRTLYPAGVSGYDFQDLVGNIISIKNNQNPIRVGIIRPDSFLPVAIPIPDPNNYYRSRIQKGGEINGSYLAFAASFSKDEMAELTLSDIARSGITFNNTVDWDTVVQRSIRWVNEHPRKDTSNKRVWVKSAVLTRRIYTAFSNISTDAKAVVGEAVGVKTGTYNKSSTDIKSVILAFDYFDIDELVSTIEKKSITEMNLLNEKQLSSEIDEILKTVRYEEMLEGEIQFK